MQVEMRRKWHSAFIVSWPDLCFPLSTFASKERYQAVNDQVIIIVAVVSFEYVCSQGKRSGRD